MYYIEQHWFACAFAPSFRKTPKLNGLKFAQAAQKYELNSRHKQQLLFYALFTPPPADVAVFFGYFLLEICVVTNS